MCVFTQCASKAAVCRFVAVAGVLVAVCAVPAWAQPTPIPSRLSLADAVSLAVQRNPSVLEATAASDAADADRIGADRRLNPAFSLDSVGSQELTVRVDQEFETAGRRRLRTAVAESGREVAQAGVRDTRRLVELNVRRAYLATVLAEADRTVAQTALEEIDKVIALNRARFNQGEISGADIRRLQVERLRFVEDVFGADLAARNGRSALLAILNAPTLDQPLELTDGLAVTTGELSPLLAAAAAGASGRSTLLAQALAARPDMLGAQQAEALAETTTRLQRALRTPNLTFGAGYQRNFGANVVVFGATVPLPFFNRNQGGVLRADAERRAAAARSALLDTGVRLDVQRTLNAVEVNRARVGYIEREYLTSARESRDIVLESYRLGVANLIDYLDAQRAFRDTQRTYNRALFDQRLSLFELAAAVGFTDVQR
jgi:cobalt-zinc-cadmium efflux system outer membrane protein